MSAGKNQELSFWEALRAKLGDHRYCINSDKIASERQNAIIADAYWLMLSVWSDVCGTLPQGFHGKACSALARIPVVDLVQVLKDLDRTAIELIRFKGNLDTIVPFKRVLLQGGIDAHVRGVILDMISSVIVRSQRDDISAFKDLHQIFCFIGRLNLPDREDLEEEAEMAYLSQQEAMDCFVYPVETIFVKRIIDDWFPNTVETYEALYGDWVPRHGDGSVAEGNLDIADKYLSFKKDADLEYFDLLTGGLGFPRPIPEGLVRTSKVQFVPKSATSLRTISAEPAILQFYQQGCMRSIYRYIGSHRYLRRRIDTSFPERNRGYAYLGSYDGEFSTIDLSAASDSVTWSLVSYLFRDTPLYPMLACTRSTVTELPDGKKVQQRSFAPMGSSLCFPVECIVFSAITEASIMAAGGRPQNSDYCVYGDDIVVEGKYDREVMDFLVALNFTVNEDKSFTYSEREIFPFRESCGGEYVHGHDVTPLRIPRRFAGLSVKSILGNGAMYEGLIDLANSMFMSFPLGRRLILSALLNLPKWGRPLFVEVGEEGGVISTQPSNFHLLKREFVDPITTPGPKGRHTNWYQRTRYKHGINRAERYILDPEVEDLKLYEILRRSASDGTDHDILWSLLPKDNDGRTFIRRQDHGPTAGRLASGWTL